MVVVRRAASARLIVAIGRRASEIVRQALPTSEDGARESAVMMGRDGI